MSDEKIRLVLETLGVENVRQATKALKEMAAATDSLEGEIDQLARSIADGVEKPMERFLVTLKNGRKVWNDSAEAVENFGNKVGRSSKFGQNMLQASYFFDDLQYGLRGVVNNIPQMVQAFGGGAAAAGGIGIAFVAMNQAMQAFERLGGPERVPKTLKDIGTGMGDVSVATQKTTKELEKLEKITHPTTAQFILYKKATDDLAASKEKLAKQTEALALAEKNAKMESEAANKEKEETASVFDDIVNKQGRGKEVLDQLAKAGADVTVNRRGAEMDAAIKSGDFSKDKALKGAMSDIRGDGMNMFKSDDEIAEMARRRVLAKVRASASVSAKPFAASVLANIQGKGTLAEQQQALKRIRLLDPGLAAELSTEMQARGLDKGVTEKIGGMENQNKLFQAQFDAGMAPGAQMRGLMEDANNNAALQGRKKTEAELARDAEIRNQWLQNNDPRLMAAQRQVDAAKQGPFARKAMPLLERQDVQRTTRTFMEMGMSEVDAEAAARESLMGGKQAFNEFAGGRVENQDGSKRSIGDFVTTASDVVGKNVDALGAATLLLQQHQIQLKQREQESEIFKQQINGMIQGMQAPARPQGGHARK